MMSSSGIYRSSHQDVVLRFMTIDELTQLVALGEGLTIEFKNKVPNGERIAKEVIALANTRGGRLLVGVDDSGEIKGVRDSDEEEYALNEALSTLCRPAVSYSIERVPISKKRNVLLVKIPESKTKPHELIDPEKPGDRGTVYIRIDEMSMEASKEHVRLMRTQKRREDVVFEFGDKEQVLMRYLENYGQITVAQFARLANIPRRRASHTLVLLTKANVLQLHTDPKNDYFTLAYGVR